MRFITRRIYTQKLHYIFLSLRDRCLIDNVYWLFGWCFFFRIFYHSGIPIVYSTWLCTPRNTTSQVESKQALICVKLSTRELIYTHRTCGGAYRYRRTNFKQLFDVCR